VWDAGGWWDADADVDGGAGGAADPIPKPIHGNEISAAWGPHHPNCPCPWAASLGVTFVQGFIFRVSGISPGQFPLIMRNYHSGYFGWGPLLVGGSDVFEIVR